MVVVVQYLWFFMYFVFDVVVVEFVYYVVVVCFGVLLDGKIDIV